MSSAAIGTDLYHNDQIDVRWDNTLRYTAAFRLFPRDHSLLYYNNDDGDRNFEPGLISNRLDLLSQFEVTDGDFGLRLSMAGWYDTVYLQHNDNDSPATFNPFSVPHNQFTRAVQTLHGKDIELGDAFVYGSAEVGGLPLQVRIGRFAQVWGESVFFGDNSIAAGQAPTDVIRELSQPSSYASQLFLPVWQASATLQPTDNISIGAYYQFQWRKDRLPGSGSYFSYLDYLDEGGERFYYFPHGHFYRTFYRTDDLTPPATGQFGLSLRVNNEDFGYGFYASRFDAKEPQVYLLPHRGANGSGEYQLVYPTDIELYGASFNTYIADDEVAGEVSLRRNAPLNSLPVIVRPRESADNGPNARYAVGDTLQGQVSEHHIFAAGALWERAELNAEIAANDRLDVTRNTAALDPRRDRFAAAFEATFEPEYFEVLPSLDLSLPITFGHGLVGRSSTQETQDFPGAGELSFGVSATYRNVWQASLSMTHFIGAPTSQWLRDRDFVAFTVQRTF